MGLPLLVRDGARSGTYTTNIGRPSISTPLQGSVHSVNKQALAGLYTRKRERERESIWQGCQMKPTRITASGIKDTDLSLCEMRPPDHHDCSDMEFHGWTNVIRGEGRHGCSWSIPPPPRPAGENGGQLFAGQLPVWVLISPQRPFTPSNDPQ